MIFIFYLFNTRTGQKERVAVGPCDFATEAMIHLDEMGYQLDEVFDWKMEEDRPCLPQ
jgi:hypothetical protein